MGVTFFELQKSKEFRLSVSKRIAAMNHDFGFSFPQCFPKLYKYRNLSNYAIEDLVNGKLTLTSIGTFNDLFDGAFHEFGTGEERKREAERKWKEFEEKRIAADLPEGLLDHDYLTDLYSQHYKTESRLKFRELEYLGTYVCCFSSINDSTLMWAHYANANSGMCIEYDFNNLDSDCLLRSTLFPVVYTQNPFDLKDLLDDRRNSSIKYPLETAVLCAAINKAKVWEYEKEWRIIWILISNWNEQRFPINITVNPSSISFGYHFMRPLFYYNFENTTEREEAHQRSTDILRLLDYMVSKKIKANIMVPEIGTYRQVSIPIDISELRALIMQHFEKRAENIKYYHVIHDQLMDIIGR